MAAEPEQYSPFSCRDAIHHLCKRSRKKSAPIEHVLHSFLSESLLSVYKTHFYMVYELIKLCQVPICIIGRKQTSQRSSYACLVDVRHLDKEFVLPHVQPIYWIMDMHSERLLKETTKRAKIPALHYHDNKLKQLSASLWDILQLPQNAGMPEPQSANELKQVLAKHNLLTETNVFYCITLVPQQEMVWITGHNDSPIAPLCFFAYTKSDLSIGYAFRQPDRLDKHSLPMIEEEEETQQNEEVPDASTANRRTSVNVKLAGLLLAHTLGLCSQETMHQLSQALAHCVGAIWVTCDEERHIRHAIYKDDEKEMSIEIHCAESMQDKNVKAWTTFFQCIQKSAARLKEVKSTILAPLLASLSSQQQPTSVGSLWSQCLRQLKKTIAKHKVFVFCSDDTVLHQLKVPIAGAFKTPKSKGVYIQSLANYTITCLATPSVVFINLSEYFNFRGKNFESFNDDDNLWKVAQGYLKPDGEDSLTAWTHPELKHSILEMKHHPKVFGQSAITYTNDRGLRNADIIIKLWTTLVDYFLKEFKYEMASLPHQSLAKISFDVLWYNYALQAGPFAHPLENLHPYSVYQLRPWCRGGFSYSFQNHLKVGAPLAPNKESAKSICELDLTSAYGFSGMTMSTAKGFGIAFGDVKTQRRYKSFEYKATMYTIFKLSMMQGKMINAVFSNYSPLGLAYIGKHALDLLVVLSDKSIRLYQFDGHFCHGDYNRPYCPTLPSYANNKTRQECEQQTMQRDEAILNWLMTTMASHDATYEVLTDCCHPEYTMENLNKAFYIYHPLKDMIRGLDKLNGTLDCIDYSEVTFLAIVEGYATCNLGREFGPIFVSTTSNQKTSCPSMTGGKILLTGDYYLYLKNRFGFKVRSIEWIIYYKVCEDLPKVYRKFVLMRKEAGTPKDALLKTLVNYACGYFGLNSDKQSKLTARITYKLPKRFNIFRDEVTPLDSFGKDTLMLVRSYNKKKAARYLCNTPLVVFIQIIEFGKLRLNKAVQCLQQYLRPTAMHILYSNVDNLILALSEDTLEEALQDPQQSYQFSKEWRTFTAGGPGMLKREWYYKSDIEWQFVSPCCMFHVLTKHESDGGHHKSTLFSGLPTQEAFKIAMSVLNKQRIKVDQEKKKDKLAGTDTHIVTYHF